MDALEQLGREKVYYDNTVDYHLIISESIRSSLAITQFIFWLA